MNRVTLDRFYQSDVQTRGILSAEVGGEERTAFTLELPWKDNQRRVSRIPSGQYRLEPRPAEHSGSFGYDHFIVRGVPGRDYILFHQGAFHTHTAGCVLVGLDFQDVNGDGHPDLLHTEKALSRLRRLIGEKSTKLVVRDRFDAAEGPVPAAEPEKLDVDLPEVPELA